MAKKRLVPTSTTATTTTTTTTTTATATATRTTRPKSRALPSSSSSASTSTLSVTRRKRKAIATPPPPAPPRSEPKPTAPPSSTSPSVPKRKRKAIATPPPPDPTPPPRPASSRKHPPPKPSKSRVPQTSKQSKSTNPPSQRLQIPPPPPPPPPPQQQPKHYLPTISFSSTTSRITSSTNYDDSFATNGEDIWDASGSIFGHRGVNSSSNMQPPSRVEDRIEAGVGAGQVTGSGQNAIVPETQAPRPRKEGLRGRKRVQAVEDDEGGVSVRKRGKVGGKMRVEAGKVNAKGKAMLPGVKSRGKGRGDVEILVHQEASSPFSMSREERYRRQAAMVAKGFGSSSVGSGSFDSTKSVEESEALGSTTSVESVEKKDVSEPQLRTGGVGGVGDDRGAIREGGKPGDDYIPSSIPSNYSDDIQPAIDDSQPNGQQLLDSYYGAGGWGGNNPRDDDEDLYSLGGMDEIEEIEELLKGYEKRNNIPTGNKAGGGGGSSSQVAVPETQYSDPDGGGDDGIAEEDGKKKEGGEGEEEEVEDILPTPEGFGTLMKRLRDLEEEDSQVSTSTPTPRRPPRGGVEEEALDRSSSPYQPLPGSSQYEAQLLEPLPKRMGGGDEGEEGEETDYSCPYVLPDTGSWNLGSFSVPDSMLKGDEVEGEREKKEEDIHLEVPSSPMLPISTGVSPGGKVGNEVTARDKEDKIPSSQPDIFITRSVENNPEYPQILSGDLSSTNSDYGISGADKLQQQRLMGSSQVSDSLRQKRGVKAKKKAVGEAPTGSSKIIASSAPIPDVFRSTQPSSNPQPVIPSGTVARAATSSPLAGRSSQTSDGFLLPSTSSKGAKKTQSNSRITKKTPSPRRSPRHLHPPPSSAPPPPPSQQESDRPLRINLSPFPTSSTKKTYFLKSLPPPASLLTPLSPLPPSHASNQFNLNTSTPFFDSTTTSPADMHPPLPLFTGTPSPPLSQLISPPHHLLAPPPPTSSNPPIITPYLNTLIEKQHTWRKNYLPRFSDPDRVVREMERGCWVLDICDWTGEEKVKFWKGLKVSVEAGRCGIVNVFLGEEDGDGDGGLDCGGGGGGSGFNGEVKRLVKKRAWEKKRGDVLKVYCWGGVVELIWAYLYVLSSRRTKEGARWVDAAGNTVIQC